MTVQLLKHKFTTQQYHLIHEAGVFSQGDRFELINGEITEMSPIGRKHAACIIRATKLLQKKLGDLVLISVQNSIHLSDVSEPQPDFAVLTPRDDCYEEGLARPADILLLIEVADSTIAYDRNVKMPLYSAAGIPEMWLFDLNERVIEGYSQPSARGYKQMHRYEQGDIFSMLAFPDISFTWQEIF